MAVIKVTNSKATLNKAISYITKEQKTEERLVSGKDCNPSTVLEEMQATKEQFNKLEGRQYSHYVQSFAKTDNITHQKAHEIGTEWAEKNFKGHEVLIATHQDKDHVHNHFIVNSVSFEDGKKFHSCKKDLEHLKLASDKICEREGFSVIKEKSKEITSFNQKKYKAIERAFEGQYKSYVVNTALAVNKVLKTSTSREFFIKGMESQGYSVNWTDTNKNVTFTNEKGEKIRLNNLKKTFKEEKYSKEGFENEFTRLREKELAKHRESNGTERNRDGGESKGFGLSWDKSEVGTPFSGTDNCLESHDEVNGAERSREKEIIIGNKRDRKIESRNGGRSESDTIEFEKRNRGDEKPQLSENRANNKDSIGRREEEPSVRREIDKEYIGISTPSKENTKPKLERESEAIRNSTCNNISDNGGDNGSVSNNNPFSKALNTLENSTKKKKNKIEIPEIKEKEPKKRRKKDYDIEL